MREVSAPADQPDPGNNKKMHHDSYELISSADSPLSAQIKYVPTSLKSNLFQKHSIGRKNKMEGRFPPPICLVATKKIRLFTCEYELAAWLRVNQVSLLQSPEAGIHAVRWVGSSHCGTND